MADSRPGLVVRLVGIADYMSAGLEANDNHPSTCTLNMYAMNVHALQQICKYTNRTNI